MAITGFLLCVAFISVAAVLLVRKYNPQAVLLLTGLVMMGVAMLTGFKLPPVKDPTGLGFFDLFKRIQESLSDKGANVGLMIMTIGGFVAYMKAIGASNALVYVAMKPLGFFRKSPYLAASIVIPIGQLLFVCTPSAAGLGLLLVASVYPVLVTLGVSRISAAAVISACTVFDMGPASANTARAAQLIEINNVQYFIQHQLPLAIPMTVVLMISYFFVNRYYDKKAEFKPEVLNREAFKSEVPLIYAALPVLPLLLLIIFSPIFNLFPFRVLLDTTTAMIISLIVALLMELVRLKDAKKVFASLKTFWEGMGSVFASVVTLIVAAEIFSAGLISLGFIDTLTNASMSLGFGGVGIGLLMTAIIFAASMLMGSGNASFFSFGPLVPGIATQMQVPAADIILPMQLSSSMGRATSPIAGVIISIAKIAEISPFDLAKRNLIPIIITLVFMVIYHFFILT